MDDFSIAAIFSDNMVLQRNRCVSFFGEAKGDFCVHVSIFDKKKRADYHISPLPSSIIYLSP